MDQRVSAGRRAGLNYGQRVRGSGELRRRTAHSGELHGLRRRTATNGNGTSDERGVLERETNSSREEWRGSAAFYREREGRGEVTAQRASMGAGCPSWPSQASVTRRIMGEEWEEETVAALTRETTVARVSQHRARVRGWDRAQALGSATRARPAAAWRHRVGQARVGCLRRARLRGARRARGRRVARPASRQRLQLAGRPRVRAREQREERKVRERENRGERE
jgi:hypothetical protein